MKKQEIITDKQARALIDEHFEIVSESVKVKKSMLAIFRQKLPDIKVLKVTCKEWVSATNGIFKIVCIIAEASNPFVLTAGLLALRGRAGNVRTIWVSYLPFHGNR